MMHSLFSIREQFIFIYHSGHFRKLGRGRRWHFMRSFLTRRSSITACTCSLWHRINDIKQHLFCHGLLDAFPYSHRGVVSIGKRLIGAFSHEQPTGIVVVPFTLYDFMVQFSQDSGQFNGSKRVWKASDVEAANGFG